MIQLNETQQQALRNSRLPTLVVNPATDEKYVLVPAAEYEKLIAMLADENQRFAEEMAPLLWETMQADWSDPSLDAYQRLVDKP